jgi:hypothetical protein
MWDGGAEARVVRSAAHESGPQRRRSIQIFMQRLQKVSLLQLLLLLLAFF